VTEAQGQDILRSFGELVSVVAIQDKRTCP